MGSWQAEDSSASKTPYEVVHEMSERSLSRSLSPLRAAASLGPVQEMLWGCQLQPARVGTGCRSCTMGWEKPFICTPWILLPPWQGQGESRGEPGRAGAALQFCCASQRDSTAPRATPVSWAHPSSLLSKPVPGSHPAALPSAHTMPARIPAPSIHTARSSCVHTRHQNNKKRPQIGHKNQRDCPGELSSPTCTLMRGDPLTRQTGMWAVRLLLAQSLL